MITSKHWTSNSRKQGCIFFLPFTIHKHFITKLNKNPPKNQQKTKKKKPKKNQSINKSINKQPPKTNKGTDDMFLLQEEQRWWNSMQHNWKMYNTEKKKFKKKSDFKNHCYYWGILFPGFNIWQNSVLIAQVQRSKSSSSNLAPIQMLQRCQIVLMIFLGGSNKIITKKKENVLSFRIHRRCVGCVSEYRCVWKLCVKLGRCCCCCCCCCCYCCCCCFWCRCCWGSFRSAESHRCRWGSSWWRCHWRRRTSASRSPSAL